MTIDFGCIKSYKPDRGFGFVGRTFLNPNGEVFFHIRKIKKKRPELAQKLDSNEDFKEVNFWYEIERNDKGEQVSELWLSREHIPQNYTDELSGLVQKVESIWKNIGSAKPSWLDFVTLDLVGVDRKHELSIERDNSKNQLREAEEKQHREAEEKRQNEIRRIRGAHGLTNTEADELEKLLVEMRSLKFTHSKQLSNYIVKHQLGCRYRNISGIVRMEESGTEWDFNGGFPSDIYRIICTELDLHSQGTSARVIQFRSYRELSGDPIL